jgi:hypothetical protein
MNDRELERRVARWLHGEASGIAPDALRRQLATLPARGDAPGFPWQLGRTGLIAAVVALALVVGLAGAFLLRGPNVGARGCSPELMTATLDALAAVPGYSYRATGTQPQLMIVEQQPGPKLLDIAFDGGFQAPDRSFERGLPLSIEPQVPRGVPNAGTGYMIRIGNDRAWSQTYPGGTYEPLPSPPSDLPSASGQPFYGPANRLLAMLEGAAAGDRPLEWMTSEDTTLAGSGGCVLRAEDAPGSTYVYTLEVRIDDRTALPIAIREVVDQGLYSEPVNNPEGLHAGYDLTYEVDYRTIPSIEPPTP